ncbi:MAG: cytidylate kinase [Candidatus Muproteobacteria bacterium RBG_16_60_9]|uniref:Cytidylate kinase n=1 Tax=Candidatus Muproteobacteria bacterium RBG_16_60_9 TaxID=1817755 RepID=A0A1F6V8C0_9PROT|nr:MAG: cytidylate kinase [Candidatus Muproteobacteria bacterium RBG_16_60_9]
MSGRKDSTNSVDRAPVVAIDGPSGSGKGTIGELLAGRLGWNYLDSGALYRAVGVAARRAGVSLADGAALAQLAGSVDIRFVPKPNSTATVQLDGAEIGDELRTETAGESASRVAAVPAVRLALLQKQHELRRPPGLVADGRDMGTTVFPDALLKVFLTATPEVRAERRYKQLKQKGSDVNLPRLLQDIRERDARDAARAVSPLQPAADAHLLDTSDLRISEVVDRIESLLRQRGVAGVCAGI